jgi:hypothetical protein
MTHTAFTPSPTAGTNADFSDLLFSGDDDEDVVMSPATDIFSGGGVVYLIRIVRMTIRQKVSFRLTNLLSRESV